MLSIFTALIKTHFKEEILIEIKSLNNKNFLKELLETLTHEKIILSLIFIIISPKFSQIYSNICKNITWKLIEHP